MRYQNARYKKYFILKPGPHKYPQLKNDTSEGRIKEEINQYTALKSSDRLLEIDGGLTYFLINADWVNKWRKFVQN